MPKNRNKNKFITGKRGNILDIFYIGVFTLVFGIVGLISYTLMSDLQPRLDSNLNNDYSKNITASGMAAVENLDNMAIIIIVGLFIVALISAYFIKSHPVFLVASILLLLMIMLIVPILSNVYDKFSEHTSMSTAANQFQLTSSFFSNWASYFVVMSGLVIIVLYIKYRGNE